jgi:predicted lactoylglutathione lyase
VKDLPVATAFYVALGYRIHPRLADANATVIVVSDSISLVLLTERFFRTFTSRQIADTSRTVETILCLSADSRAAVDELVERALGAGGAPAKDPLDTDFAYSRSFTDPDGHLLEVVWMHPEPVPPSDPTCSAAGRTAGSPRNTDDSARTPLRNVRLAD